IAQKAEKILFNRMVIIIPSSLVKTYFFFNFIIFFMNIKEIHLNFSKILVPNLKIPKSIHGVSVTRIDDYAFYQTTVSLSTLSSVKEIGENEFSKCYIKGNEINIHFSLIRIGTRAFCNCSFENNIILTLPDSLTRIEDYTFYHCNIAAVTIPSSIEYLGEEDFVHKNFFRCISLIFIKKYDKIKGRKYVLTKEKGIMMTMQFKMVISAFCVISVLFACSVASFTNILPRHRDKRHKMKLYAQFTKLWSRTPILS
ncbi:MAG: leucine-rich repeat domain-containing protein, partial [Coprobacillus sp.]|nr:leucine-rich repeat domain-containing protein [Coprobacillus sp.]